MSLLSQTKRYIVQLSADNYSPPTSQDRLVVGVSGGADSVALLHILTEIYRADQLVVAHLHHGLRQSADSDLAHVKATAEILKLPFYSKQVDTVQLAKTNKQTIEEAGRNARYTFFAEVAKEVGAFFIVVGHHADDQAETVLFNLMRGAGLKGIGGMLPVRKQGDCHIFRPLLTAKKDDLIAFCDAHGFSYVTDETNADTIYTRNRIRQDLLPTLAAYNNNIIDHLANLAVVSQADEAILDELAETKFTALAERNEGVIQFSRNAWRDLSVGLQRRVLRKAVIELLAQGIELSFDNLEAARQISQSGETSKIATLPAGLQLTVGYKYILIGNAIKDRVRHISRPLLSEQQANSDPIPIRLNQPILLVSDAYTLTATYVESYSPPTDSYSVIIATDEPLFLRARIEGERIQPLGMNGQSASVKKIMINNKLNKFERLVWPIIATKDYPVWIVGVTIDHRARVTTHLQQYLKLTFHRLSHTTL